MDSVRTKLADRKTLRVALSLTGIVAAYCLACMVSGALVTASGVVPPREPAQSAWLIRWLVFVTVSVLGLWPLARLLPGHWATRGLLLSVFFYVTGPVNTAWELSKFTTIGGTTFMILQFILPSCATGFLMARAVTAPSEQEVNWRAALRAHSPQAWTVRLVLAWLAFPVIYLGFGMVVSPIVQDAYTGGDQLGLRIPPMDQILATALGRSATFLVSVAPILLWVRAPWRSLVMSLGWAYAALVGLAGLLSSGLMPLKLRIAHGGEICADSFLYALVLVLLLAPLSIRRPPRP